MHEAVTTEVVKYCLPFQIADGDNPSSELGEVDAGQHGYVWTSIVQFNEHVDVVENIISEFPRLAVHLAETTDRQGRQAINIASPACHQVGVDGSVPPFTVCLPISSSHALPYITLTTVHVR